MEGGVEGFEEAHGFGCDDVFEGAALTAREDLRINAFCVFFFAKDEASTRATEAFVRGGGDEVCERHGGRVHACGDESRDVGHVDEQVRADGIGDGAHAFEVDDAGVGARSGSDHARFGFERHFREVIVIDALVFCGYPVMNDVEQSTREVGFVSVGEMTPVRQIHGEDAVAGL